METPSIGAETSKSQLAAKRKLSQHPPLVLNPLTKIPSPDKGEPKISMGGPSSPAEIYPCTWQPRQLPTGCLPRTALRTWLLQPRLSGVLGWQPKCAQSRVHTENPEESGEKHSPSAAPPQQRLLPKTRNRRFKRKHIEIIFLKRHSKRRLTRSTHGICHQNYKLENKDE